MLKFYQKVKKWGLSSIIISSRSNFLFYLLKVSLTSYHFVIYYYYFSNRQQFNSVINWNLIRPNILHTHTYAYALQLRKYIEKIHAYLILV